MALLRMTVTKNAKSFISRKLNEIDFFPFKSSKAKLAMTAHILYTNLDRKNVATFSQNN